MSNLVTLVLMKLNLTLGIATVLFLGVHQRNGTGLFIRAKYSYNKIDSYVVKEVIGWIKQISGLLSHRTNFDYFVYVATDQITRL